MTVSADAPSHAELARTLVASFTIGSLGTIALDPPGFPFVSVVTYALDGQGRPILAISTLAEHTRNVEADPRASLMVAEQAPPGTDPLAVARATLVGRLELLEPGPQRDAARERFLAAHPKAFYVDFPDFRIYVLRVQAVRYVGGFGVMSWPDADEYLGAEPDPLREAAADVITHMNDDHADALVAYCKAFGGVLDTTGARMTGLDRHGFDVVAVTPSGEQPVRVAFIHRKPVNAEQVRQELIRLVQEARARLA